MTFTLTMPSRNGEPGATENIVIEGNCLVFVGANGSGKTRLGQRIQKLQSPKVRRISARRGLIVPETIQLESVKVAEGRAYRSPGFNEVQNDFDDLLRLLFARQRHRDRIYSDQMHYSEGKEWYARKDSPIDLVIQIWSHLLPHRELIFDDDTGEIRLKRVATEGTYHAQEMSDGERVALYLMGKCLCTSEGDILLIDEPEIHLHRAILSSMWDRLEALLPKNLFVYLTHDLDFAASRITAKKLWMKEFDGHQSWQWAEIPHLNEIPEEITLKILGNPRPVLFVEGDSGGLDYAIYKEIYPEWLVIPRGGCEEVIQSVKALKRLKELPSIHVQVCGIIDRDYRTDEELRNLEREGIFCTGLAEIENLLFVPEFLRAMASRLADDNVNTTVERIIDAVFSQIGKDLGLQVVRRTLAEVEHKLKNQFDTKRHELEGVKQSLQELMDSIDVDEIGIRNRTVFEQIVQTKDYQRALQVFNHKGIIQSVSSALQIGNYQGRVLSILKSEPAVLESIREYLPKLPQQ